MTVWDWILVALTAIVLLEGVLLLALGYKVDNLEAQIRWVRRR